MKRTKVFFDLEFTGLHQSTTMISIGLVSECGKKFYAEAWDYDKLQIDYWLEHNVIKNLLYKNLPKEGVIGEKNGNTTTIYGNSRSISKGLLDWLEQFEEVEMWSDCLAYDWVLFRNLFKETESFPSNVVYIPFDISTLFHLKNIDPDINREKFSEMLGNVKKHNALWDAEVIKACYYKLMNL